MLWAGPPGYPTPVFDPSDPVVCHTLKLRPSLWAVVFNVMQILGNPYSWIQDDIAAATPGEVADEINKATDEMVFAGCTMIGQIMMLATDTPEWCLECDGSIYLKADYPDLWAVLDPAYETDATHFRVPDLQARFPLGGVLLGNNGGASTVVLNEDQMPAHSHVYLKTVAAASVVLGELPGSQLGAYLPQETTIVGGNEPIDIMPPYEIVRYVIVAVQP